MRTLALLALGLFSAAAAAVSPDLKVSTDDLNEAGEHALEIQANKASAWPLQWVLEYAYGVTDEWQVAAKLPFAYEKVQDAGLHGLGATLEVRYLPAHDPDRGGYWGFNFAAGRGRERFGTPSTSGVELAPVAGYRTSAWHFAANAVVGVPASGEDRRATFFGALKGARRLDAESELGLEYFIDAGPLSSWHARHERNEYLLLAWDQVAGRALNLAVGRGLTPAAERWVLRVICALPLSR